MKEIKIGLEYRRAFEIMTNCKAKRIILGLMDAAEGKFAKGITRDILSTFMELKARLGEDSAEGERAVTPGYHGGDEFDVVLKAFEMKRASYEEKVKALRRENDTVIKAEDDALKEEGKAIGEERDALEGEYKALARRLKACDGDEDGRRKYMGKFVALERRREALTRRRKELDGRRKALIERSIDFLAGSASNLEGECNVLKEENALLKEMREGFKGGDYKERTLGFIKGRLDDHQKTPASKSEDVGRVNREEEVIGSKLNDRDSFKADAEDGLPPMPEGVTRPTEEQVVEYMCKSLNVREDVAREEARKFLEYYDKRGSWKNKDEGCETDTEEIVFPPDVWKVIDENWEELKDAVCKIKAEKEKSEDIPLSVLEDIPLSVEAWDVLDHHFDELARLFHI